MVEKNIPISRAKEALGGREEGRNHGWHYIRGHHDERRNDNLTLHGIIKKVVQNEILKTVLYRWLSCLMPPPR